MSFLAAENIRHEVELQLLSDLSRVGIEKAVGLTIDWSDGIPEGHGCSYGGTYLESSSNIQISDGDGATPYSGWVDYIVDEGGRLSAYWTELEARDPTFAYHRNFEIPDNIWDRLSEGDRMYLARTHQGWSQDKKMLPYRSIVVTGNITTLSKTLRASLENLPHGPSAFGLNMDVFRKEAESMLELARRFLSGEKLDPNISTLTYTLRVEPHESEAVLSANDAAKLLRLLLSLEREVRHAAVVFLAEQA
jgi:hypothetical protein